MRLPSIISSHIGLGAAFALLGVLPASLGNFTNSARAGEEDERGEAAEIQLFVQTGEYETAEDAIREKLDASPDDETVQRQLAEVLAYRGKYDDALSVLETSKNFKKSSPLLTVAGSVYRSTGRLGEAEKVYRAASMLDGNNVEALNRLGGVLAQSGRRDEAQAKWNQVVDVYQSLTLEEAEALPAEAYVEMGVALRSLNRYEDANETMFPQARDQDEECLPLLVEWSRTYLDKYDFPFSRTLLRKALDVNPNYVDARVLMAKNYLIDYQVGTKRYELADKQLRRAIETNPRHAGAYSTRGSLWLSDGDLPRAIADFEKSLDINPADQETLGLLAATYHLMGGAEDKMANAEKRALKINPRSSIFYHTIALAIERRFRYAEAAEMSEKALALNPDYWPAYHTLGINYLRMGREKEGREYLAKSFAKDPFNIWVVNTRKLLRYIDKNHVEIETERFHFRFPRSDALVLKSFLVPLMDAAYDKLSKHYQTELKPPIHIDVFSTHQWFSAKITGLGGFPATGACFGNVVALTTPKALPQNWGAVAWHEFAHVVTLHVTKNQIPRWLTEGLSVFEEGRDHPHWTRNFTREIADTYDSGRLLALAELDSGFSKPKYPMQVLISYYQGCLVVTYITEKWGFDKVLAILAGYREKKATTRIFDEVFGITLEEFDRGFFAWLDAWVKSNGYQGVLHEENVATLELDVEERPDDIKLLVDLAWAYFSTGNPIDPALTAQKVLKLDAKNGDALAILGFTQVKDGKIGAARKTLASALENETRFQFRVHEQLGRIALKAGRKKDAIEHFEKAKTISPKAGAGFPASGKNLYYVLAGLYNKADESEKAVATLEELRMFAVEDARCRATLAKHYILQDDDASARKAFEILEEVMFINPFDKNFHDQLARVAARLGEHRAAIREYGYLLGLADTNPKVAYTALAEAHLGLGEKDQAESYARKVLDIDEGDERAKAVIDKLETE